MKKRILILSAALLCLTLLFTACSTTMARDYAAMESPGHAGGWDSEESWDTELFVGGSYGSFRFHSNARVDSVTTTQTHPDGPGAPLTENAEPTDELTPSSRMRIRDVHATIDTRQFDRYLAAVQARAAELDGYVQSIEVSDRWTRHANLILRVPAVNLDDFLESLEEDDSHVANLRDSVRDVTLQHNDLQAEMTALREEEEALQQLLRNSGNLSDLLAVQNQLSGVRHRINRLEGQIRILQDQVAYSTVSLSISEVERIIDTEQGFWARTFDGFVNSLRGVGNGVLAFVSGVFIVIPWLVLIVLPLGVVAWLVLRNIRKRRKAKKENSQKNT